MREMLGGLRAEDLMARDFVTVTRDLPLSKLVDEYILRKCAHTFLVVNNGQLKGIVCLDDVKGISRDKWQSSSVGDVMTPKAQLDFVAPEDDGNAVLARLNAKDVR